MPSSERAAEIVKLVGTEKGQSMYPEKDYMKANSNGKPTFKLLELLDLFQLKSYTSYQMPKIKEMIQKTASGQFTEVEDEDELDFENDNDS